MNQLEQSAREIIEYRLKDIKDNLASQFLYKYSAKFFDIMKSVDDLIEHRDREEYFDKYNELIKEKIMKEKNC